MSIEDGSLGTPRARQLRTIGHNFRTSLMSEDIMDLSIEALTDTYNGYEEDLGNGVKRRIKIVGSDEESLEIQVRLTGYREAERHYIIHLKIEELETIIR